MITCCVRLSGIEQAIRTAYPPEAMKALHPGLHFFGHATLQSTLHIIPENGDFVLYACVNDSDPSSHMAVGALRVRLVRVPGKSVFGERPGLADAVESLLRGVIAFASGADSLAAPGYERYDRVRDGGTLPLPAEAFRLEIAAP